ncbi:AAA-associated domain-containing protein [Streptomyces sp. NPDC093546]|uniref:AAA-associated domain-containing protein n=1 Tax=Streptomyces sp. NPDC093546 TaxID=3366040 RepID=UPI0038270968
MPGRFGVGKDGLQINSAGGPAGGPGGGPVIDHDAHGKAGGNLTDVQIAMQGETRGKLGKARSHHGRAKGKDSLTAVLDTTIDFLVAGERERLFDGYRAIVFTAWPGRGPARRLGPRWRAGRVGRGPDVVRGAPAASRLRREDRRRLAQEMPAHFIAFDLLQLDGQELPHVPYGERRAQLEQLFTDRGLSAPWTLCSEMTRPGDGAGVKMLLHRGGSSDLADLADDLGLEIDDILPLVDALDLLGFAKVSDGDLLLTDTGTAFAGADVQQSKTIFAEAALGAPLIRLITTSLRQNRDGTLRAGFFRDVLAHHFTSEQVTRQLETATDWGRYAELYSYDAEPREYRLVDSDETAPRKE